MFVRSGLCLAMLNCGAGWPADKWWGIGNFQAVARRSLLNEFRQAPQVGSGNFFGKVATPDLAQSPFAQGATLVNRQNCPD